MKIKDVLQVSAITIVGILGLTGMFFKEEK